MRAFAGMCLLVLFSSVVFAQAVSTPAPAAFDLADVHASPHTTTPFMQGGVLYGDRYFVKNATMVNLITLAYGVDADRVAGGPSWLDTDRFDVIAKAPPGTSPDSLKLMLQALLADRFKLLVHNDTKPMPAFVLTVGKGSKLKEADGSENPGCQGQPQNPAPGTIPYNMVSCHNMTMEMFAQNIHQMAGAYLTSPVVDQTGLKGSWDFDLKWTSKGLLAQAGADGISVFAAVDKQLGLKLEPQKVPMPVIAVDSVNEKPTDNPPGVTAALPTPPPAEFEVAVIKPSMPDERTMLQVVPSGQVNITGVTLGLLIHFAWGLNPNDKEVLVGAPKWLDSDKFDIVAKASTEAAASNTPQISIDDLRQMLRTLLIDRFKMVVHTEDRPVSAYTLTATNPKLKKADPTNRTGCKEGPGPDGKDPRIANPILGRLLACTNMTMAQFAEQLQTVAGGYIFSPVVDSTGLEGAWDFTLSFSPAGALVGGGPGGDTAPSAVGAASAPDPSGALSLIDAVNKQLGLKLVMQKRPMPVLVIDHVEEKPTEN